MKQSVTMNSFPKFKIKEPFLRFSEDPHHQVQWNTWSISSMTGQSHRRLMRLLFQHLELDLLSKKEIWQVEMVFCHLRLCQHVQEDFTRDSMFTLTLLLLNYKLIMCRRMRLSLLLTIQFHHLGWKSLATMESILQRFSWVFRTIPQVRVVYGL